MSVAAAIALGATSIGMGLYNAYQQRKLNERTEERQDTSYQRQVADLKAAGLSPLMAGNGGSPSGGLTSPSLDPSSAVGAYSAYQQASLTRKQQKIDSFNAETARINALTQQDDVNSNIALRDAQESSLRFRTWLEQQGAETELQIKSATLDKLRSDTAYTNAQNLRSDAKLCSDLGIAQKQYDKMSAEEQNIIADTVTKLAQNRSSLMTQEIQRTLYTEDITLKRLESASVSKKLEWFDELSKADVDLKRAEAEKMSVESKLAYVNAVTNVVSAVGRFSSLGALLAL